MRNMRVAKLQFHNHFSTKGGQLRRDSAFSLHSLDIMAGKTTPTANHALPMFDQFRIC